MFEDFHEKLENVDSPEHGALLGHVKGLVDISRGDMSKHFSRWDDHDRIFRSEREYDKEDMNSERKGSPKKMLVPLTFSQILTFVSFNVMSITQNRRFFELEPTGTEDNPLMEPLELLLERDLRRNTWNTFLIQFFLDIGRFSLAAAEVCYTEEFRYMRVEEEVTEEGAFGAPQAAGTSTSYQKLPHFIGNRVFPVSPYRFLPDTRLPMSRYQEGEFCGSEDLFPFSSLQSQPNIINIDKIKKYTEDAYRQRVSNSRVDLGLVDRAKNPNLLGYGTSENMDSGTMVKTGPVVVTKMVFDLVPKNLMVGKDHPLGDQEFPIRYLCWIANDGTIVRFEEAYYLHCKFPYICGQYLPDQHKLVNQGLADICDQITNLITWLLNAHVASQENSVQSKWIIDPAGIDVKGLESRSPYIYLKKGASLSGVDRYIKQFATVDTTQNVMSDIGALKDMLEGITGNSAQMQGQYSTGRRSATQDRVVAQGAGARGKTILSGIWDTAFEPLGKQLIINNRQEMDLETFVRILGQREWPINPAVQPEIDPMTGMPGPPVRYTIEEIFQLFKATPTELAMAEDFFVFDGTLPSEKAFLAQSLQEILMQVLQNPAFSSVLGFGPEQIRELFNQVYILRGVTPARLPTGGTIVPPPQEESAGGQPPKEPRELIKVGLQDLAGDERKQALELFGIKADESAHDKLLRLEHPAPASKSNGSRS